MKTSSKIIWSTLFGNSKKYCIILLSIVCSTSGCKRNEPGLNTTVHPPETVQLQPIATHYLGVNILEPSGIVYNAKNNSFLVVSDSHPEIYEIDVRGNLMRTITTTSTDLEGISLSKNNDTIFVVEEKNRKVVSYLISGTKLNSFSADVATLPNNALEGITCDNNGHLFVLNEKSPGMLLEYTLTGSEIKRTPLSLALDYSDIFYDESEDCLWLISDESLKILKVDRNGTLLSQWSLPFSKGEGISIVRDTMYVVNDADAKLYIFNKPK